MNERRERRPPEGDEREPPRDAPDYRSVLWLAYGLGALALFYLLWSGFTQVAAREIPYSAFKTHLARGEVVSAHIDQSEIRGRIEPRDDVGGIGLPAAPPTPPGDAEAGPFDYRTVRVEDPGLVEELIAREVEFTGVTPNLWRELLAVWLLPLALLAALWIMLSRRAASAPGGLMGFGRSRARLVADRDIRESFADVAGCDEAKTELAEVVDFLKTPARYRALGARIPKGVLLVGPPGTGKTLLARAVAGEAGVPFFSLSGSEFVEMFVGVGAARVRDLFEQAKRQAPCLVFIDELDAVGRQRGVHVVAGQDEREQTLNQLLVELDGFEPNSGVILLAATNRPDVLDRALLRPGRFDRQVVLDAPDVVGRLAILEVHVRGMPLAGGVDLEKVARATPGFSGADLANVVNEAALLAARGGEERIPQALLEEAIEKVVAGPERKSRRLGEAEKRRVACHEVGHALVAALCEHADPLHKISIVPRGRAALGYTLQLPTGDRLLQARSELLDRLRGLMGGRAAEELVFGEPSTGAQNDLEQATALAREMITMYGMGESAGLMECGRRESPYLPREAGGRPDCSEETARDIDREVKQILADAHTVALGLLREHRAALDGITEELLRRETLGEREFHELLERYGAARESRPA